MASLASPFYYNRYPLETVDIGTTVTRKLLEKCKEWNARFIFFSSSEIYSNPSPENIPTKEEDKGYVSCQGTRFCHDESKSAEKPALNSVSYVVDLPKSNL